MLKIITALSTLQYKDSVRDHQNNPPTGPELTQAKFSANIYRHGNLNMPVRMRNILSMSPQPDLIEIITWVQHPKIISTVCPPTNRPTERRPRKPLYRQHLARAHHRPPGSRLRLPSRISPHSLATPRSFLHPSLEVRRLNLFNATAFRRPGRGGLMVQNYLTKRRLPIECGSASRLRLGY